MRKNFFPITLILAILFGLSVAGYISPEKKEKIPVRILFKNSGGKVIFTHIRHHRDYEIPCDRCHHERETSDQDPLPCSSCHPESFNKNYVREHIRSFPDTSYCNKCHHAELGKLNFDHKAHEEYADEDCQTCHHDTNIEDKPQKCGNCHTNAGTSKIPSVRNAAHDRCINCHDEMFDEGLKGCTPCHKMQNMKNYSGDYTACGQCHQENDKDLVLNRASAFHDQCMDCHKEMKRGPYKDNECSRCHLK